MKTLTEIESMCQRILGVLDHDDMRSGNLVALGNMLARMQDDLKSHLAAGHAAEGQTPELHTAEDALGMMNNDVLWLQEYGRVKPVVEVSQKLRMATLRALRVATVLQTAATVTGSGSRSSAPSRPSTTAQVATRA
jgi:hypothetical protein